MPAYTANGSTQCVPVSCNVQNCYVCYQNNICNQCLLGFYLTVNANNQQACVPTRANISNCQNQIANCAMCVVNLISGPNIAINQTYCVQCMNGFEFDASNSVCIPQTNSIPNCKIQANLGYYTPPYCTFCEQGYFINTYGICQQYNPPTNNSGCSVYNCMYCGLNSTQCSFCFIPWGISSTGQCQTTANCSANCQFCANPTTCLTCATGFTLNAPNTCVQCNVTNCQLCQQTNVCANCATGFSLTGANSCLQCNVAGCTNCSEINICSICSNSASGMQRFPSPTGAFCFQCSTTLPNMANCLSCSADNSCGLCQNGFQLFTPSGGSGVCIQCNISNCQSCGLNGATVVCQTCAIGYSLNGANCIQCNFPCATCNSNQAPNNCLTCQTPLYLPTALSNGTCAGSTVPNCLTYSSINNTICAVCITSYTLNSTSNICQFSCPTNCQTCSSSTQCTQCVAGFFLPANGTCTQCQVTGCSSCSNNGMVCNQCFLGFYSISG